MTVEPGFVLLHHEDQPIKTLVWYSLMHPTHTRSGPVPAVLVAGVHKRSWPIEQRRHAASSARICKKESPNLSSVLAVAISWETWFCGPFLSLDSRK